MHAAPAALPADGAAGARGVSGALARGAAHGLVLPHAAFPAAGERGARVREEPASSQRVVIALGAAERQ